MTTQKKPQLKGQTFQMRVEDEFLELVDNWRYELRPVPSRAEAIRFATREYILAKERKKR